ncbi:DUF4240 domain-containing protein [Lacipirellula sp.]|uniref:DUF4240 domain-containing protein n=1 Tax=Lacipirellula sp. TaxID=2691419 RepID=UPI003D10D718
MERDVFWKIIDDSRRSAEDVEDVPSEVASRLAKLQADEIISFKQHQWDLDAESYRWDLWAVAYIVNGGCSDDLFDYFRGWLLANGKKRFEAALANPEVIGKWTEEEVELEDMLYAADDAYQQVTGEKIPIGAITNSRPPEPVGDAWEEDDLESMYPKLWAKFE